jgi:gamma-glutamyl-gamma-aminobutyrate hydrolase PuuD
MKVVAVTMRHDLITDRDEPTDLIDSRWYDFLRKCGFSIALLPNDIQGAEELLRRVQPDGILLTGGGDPKFLTGITSQRDDVESLALKWATAKSVPIIGICRGMEVLLNADGIDVHPIPNHMRTVHRINGDIGREVNSFHRYGSLGVGNLYDSAFISDDGCVECIVDKNRLRYGVMWHPERNHPFNYLDIQLFSQWLQGIN